MANQIKSSKSALFIELEVAFIKEGNQYVAYCPSLELSGYGETEQDAKESFNISLNIFIEDTTQKGTLEKVLLNLGWKLTKNQYHPPKMSYQDLVMIKNSENISKQKVLIP